VVCLILAGAAWIAVTGLIARTELLAAQRDLHTLRQSVTAGPSRDTAGAPVPGTSNAEATLRSAAAHAARAHDLTTGPAWYPATHLPFLGDLARIVRGTAHAADRLTHDVLTPLVRSVPDLTADVRGGDPHRLLTALHDAAPALERAAQDAAEVRAHARGLPHATWLPAAERARTQLVRQLDRIAPTTADAALAARLLPPMLGEQGPRRYFVVFQNTAEARGTGGLPGAFAVVTADRGRIGFDTFGNDTVLQPTRPTVDLGTDYAALYAANEPTRFWGNSNLSPHFPYAARIWAEAWREHSGQKVDGVLAVDPTVLGRLLEATGPARLPDGTLLTGANAVELTERTSYAAYQDLTARKAFFLDVARTAATRLTGAAKDPRRIPALLRVVYDVQRDARLKVWSTLPAEQRLIEPRAFSGSLPKDAGPFAGVVVNNAAATKLDYYLDRRLTWEPGPCTPHGRTVTATVTLTNRAPASGLPAYVTDRLDTRARSSRPGDNRLLVSYYASAGAALTGAMLDGRRIPLNHAVEHGHPVYTLDLELPAGSTRTVTLRLLEPITDRAPTLLRQQLVNPLRTEVKPYPPCRR
jgi:HAMP domain-containing protein